MTDPNLDAIINKITSIREKTASVIALLTETRAKYRAAKGSATTLPDLRAKMDEIDAALGAHEGELAEAVFANTDVNDNGVPDRDEPLSTFPTDPATRPEPTPLPEDPPV